MKQQHSIGTPVRCDDVDDRLDVGGHRPGGTIGADAKTALANLRRQPLDVTDHVRAGPRQADIGAVDLEGDRAGAESELLLDGRRTNRRRLQAVAQRLIVQRDCGAGRRRPGSSRRSAPHPRELSAPARLRTRRQRSTRRRSRPARHAPSGVSMVASPRQRPSPGRVPRWQPAAVPRSAALTAPTTRSCTTQKATTAARTVAAITWRA